MKAQSIFTAFAITAALALPACASHKPKGPEIDRQVVSGDPATGNYVERVTEKGANFSKTTTVTHSVAKEAVPAGVVIDPNVTKHSVKEVNVRKVTKKGKTHVEQSSTESHSVTPVAKPVEAPAKK